MASLLGAAVGWDPPAAWSRSAVLSLLAEAPAAAFARLHDSAAAVRRVVPDASWISAGMSGDFVEAIAAGATHLRIGTAITGARPAHG